MAGRPRSASGAAWSSGSGSLCSPPAPPPRGWIERARATGADVWLRVWSPSEAVDAAARGATGLIADSLALVSELRELALEQLLIADGDIDSGTDIAAALRAGADGAWVDGRLIASGGVFDAGRPAARSAQLLMAEARTELARARMRAQTGTSWSRSAWLSEVFRSVDWERRPMISAAGSP